MVWSITWKLQIGWLKIPFLGGYQQRKQTAGCWQLSGCSLMKPARKLLSGPTPPRLPSLWPGSKRCPHVTAHPQYVDWTRSKGLCFWRRATVRCQTYDFCQKIDLIALRWKEAHVAWVLSAAPGRLMISGLCPTLRAAACVSLLLALSSVTTLLFQSDQLGSSHITLALETKWCHMFWLSEPLVWQWYYTFIAKATQPWADSQNIDRLSMLPTIHRHLEFWALEIFSALFYVFSGSRLPSLLRKA